MTQKEFDNYRFGIKTLVKFHGEWSSITEVWFNEGKIGIKKTGHLAHYSEIEEIKEVEVEGV